MKKQLYLFFSWETTTPLTVGGALLHSSFGESSTNELLKSLGLPELDESDSVYELCFIPIEHPLDVPSDLKQKLEASKGFVRWMDGVSPVVVELDHPPKPTSLSSMDLLKALLV